MVETIGEAYINIMPSTENFGSELTNSLSGLGTVATGAGVAIGAAVTAGIGMTVGLTNAVSDLGQATDLIDKNSQKLGVSASFYQEWDAVLQHSGTSMDAMTATFKKLATSSQDATDSQIAAYEALGLTMDEVASMSSEELFTSVITGLQGMEESTERTALATELLGRGAMELGPLLNTTAEDTQAMIDTVNELGGVLGDDVVEQGAKFQDNLQDLQTAMSGLMNSMLAEFLPGFNEVMEGLTSFLAGDEEGLNQVSAGIENILNNITQMLPEFLELAGSIVGGLAEAIIDNLPFLMQTGMEIISDLGNYILQNAPMLINTALELIVQFANDISASLPELIPSVVEVMLTIIDTLIDNIGMLVDATITLMTALAEGLINAMPILLEKAPEIIIALVQALAENTPKLIECALTLMIELGKGLYEAIPEVVSAVPEIMAAIIVEFGNYLANMAEIGGQLIEGLWNGISNKTSWIIDKIKSFGDSVMQGLKDFFGIASPSKKMRDEVGKWLPEGMAIGIEANADAVTDAMNDIASDTLSVGTDISGNLASYDYNFTASNDNSKMMDLLSQYLPIIADGMKLSVALQGDAEKMFSMMQKQSKIYSNQTGRPAFS